jgi:hypothetical protein
MFPGKCLIRRLRDAYHIVTPKITQVKMPFKKNMAGASVHVGCQVKK